MTTFNDIYHIGVMVGNIHTQHPKELVEGIYEAAKNENVNITLFLGTQGNAFEFWKDDNDDSKSYHYQFNGLYDYALISRLDVIIISYGTLCIYFDQQDREEFFKKFRQVPLVILEEYDEDSDDSYIMSDNYNSMKKIMDHLLNHHQYKRIVHLSGPKNNMDANQRRQCYIDSMNDAGLEVTDSMIEYGDYSTDVDLLINKLLDNNKNVEAIVCANDEMAMSAYRVCKQRGLRIGQDISITGYDDIELAQRMDPPLTTCEQDGLYMGYTAFKVALSVCIDKKSKKMMIPARFMKRSSCGCGISEKEIDSFESTLDQINGYDDLASIKRAAKRAAEDSMRSVTLTGVNKACEDYFLKLLILLFKISIGVYGEGSESYISEYSLRLIRDLFDMSDQNHINISRFTEKYHYIINYVEKKTEDRNQILLQNKVFDVTDTYIESYMLYQSAGKYSMILRKSWMAPAMIQKMIENADNEKRFYELAMEHIKAQGAKSAFIFLLKKPERYRIGEEFVCPEEMYLASEYINDKIISYNEDERPMITSEDGINFHYPDSAGHRYVAYILFAEEYQFGLMLCETDISEFGILYGIGLQISTAQAYLQISKKEAVVKKQLYNTLKKLEEKNQILNFTSSFDSMTNVYNRRGLMEKAIHFVNKNEGKKAAIFFSDLDHLKQINDMFGHSEGDYAICRVANILKEVFDEPDFSGRIGGDEFISLALIDNDSNAIDKTTELDKLSKKLNNDLIKPYYIDFSTGFFEFICDKDYSIQTLIDRADKKLYREKKNRRESILKDQK